MENLHPGSKLQVDCVPSLTVEHEKLLTLVQAPAPPPLYVQPARPVQVASVDLLEHEALCWATQVPLPEAVQPGSEAQPEDEQLAAGVPLQCGPVLKMVVALGKRVSADLQQI